MTTYLAACCFPRTSTDLSSSLLLYQDIHTKTVLLVLAPRERTFEGGLLLGKVRLLAVLLIIIIIVGVFIIRPLGILEVVSDPVAIHLLEVPLVRVHAGGDVSDPALRVMLMGKNLLQPVSVVQLLEHTLTGVQIFLLRILAVNSFLDKANGLVIVIIVDDDS